MKTPYQKVLTEDGSPTLLWSKDDEIEEYMHHSGGALTESLYIYHEALSAAKTRGWPLRVFSLGLGIGYNEMIALAEGATKIWSFEAVPILREGFLSWMEEKAHPLAETYAEVARLVAAKFGGGDLRAIAAAARKAGNLELHGAYPENAAVMSGVTCVFYDAYSKKMSPELWGENEIVTILSPVLAPECVFTTYAALGSLNRALKTLGFVVGKKRGFSGKRESTFAVRSS